MYIYDDNKLTIVGFIKKDESLENESKIIKKKV